MDNPFNKFVKYFSESAFWNKLNNFAKKAGIRTVYSATLLYYAFKRKDTPGWAKRIIMGVLGYFLMPIDAIPDLTFIIGYTDDIGILGLGLVTVAAYVNDEVKRNAQNKLKDWFGDISAADIEAVHEKLDGENPEE